MFCFVVFVSFCMAASNAAVQNISYEQIGSVFTGTKYAALGSQVTMSADGQVVAFGAMYGNYVVVYEHDETHSDIWAQLGVKILVDSNADSMAGMVSLSGDGTYLAIGAPGANYYKGKAALFVKEASGYTQSGETIEGEFNQGYFGMALGVSNEGTLVVSTPHWDDLKGLVQIFNSSLTPVQQFGLGNRGFFGCSLSMSLNGQRLFVGARLTSSFWYTDSDSRSTISTFANGGVFTFELNDNNEWEELGVGVFGSEAYSSLGWDVDSSADGFRFIAGAPTEDAGELDDTEVYNSGAAYVYEWDSATNDWVQLGSDFLGSEPSDKFGEAVCMNGDGTRVAIGAPEADNGIVYVYVLDEEAMDYVLVAELTMPLSPLGEAYGRGMEFGKSLATNEAGTRLVVGAPTWSSVEDNHYQYYAGEGSVFAMVFETIQDSGQGSGETGEGSGEDQGNDFSDAASHTFQPAFTLLIVVVALLF